MMSVNAEERQESDMGTPLGYKDHSKAPHQRMVNCFELVLVVEVRVKVNTVGSSDRKVYWWVPVTPSLASEEAGNNVVKE